jgi:CRISPR system Cascade subunit CasB
MHQIGIGLGAALSRIKQIDAPQRLDRRVAAAATATSLSELDHHLQGLIQLLRSHNQGLDYTKLYWDLFNFQYPGRTSQIRRQWGSQYFSYQPATSADSQDTSVSTPA